MLCWAAWDSTSLWWGSRTRQGIRSLVPAAPSELVQVVPCLWASVLFFKINRVDLRWSSKSLLAFTLNGREEKKNLGTFGAPTLILQIYSLSLIRGQMHGPYPQEKTQHTLKLLYELYCVCHSLWSSSFALLSHLISGVISRRVIMAIWRIFLLFDFLARHFRKLVKLKRTNISRHIWEIINHPLSPPWIGVNSIWFLRGLVGHIPQYLVLSLQFFPP